MSDLSFIEKSQLEKLFQMGGGYVLDFSNRTFQEFVTDVVQKNIDDPKYNNASGSKANRLRQFWKIEPNHVVGVLTRQMVDYAATVPNVDQNLVPQGQRLDADNRHRNQVQAAHCSIDRRAAVTCLGSCVRLRASDFHSGHNVANRFTGLDRFEYPLHRFYGFMFVARHKLGSTCCWFAKVLAEADVARSGLGSHVRVPLF